MNTYSLRKWSTANVAVLYEKQKGLCKYLCSRLLLFFYLFIFSSYYWQMCYFNSKAFLHSHRQIERQLHPEKSQSRSCKLELFGESGFLYICKVFLRFFYSKQTLFFFFLMEIETIFIVETCTIASSIYIFF